MSGFIKGLVGFLVIVAILAVSFIAWWGESKNTCVNKHEAVLSSWGQVQNVYQRRTDLIPNLVATVKGYSTHEEDTLVKVTQARSAVVNIQADQATLANNPKVQQQYMQAQQGLTSALNGLHVVMEKYPDLKANEGYLQLQSQLEGTENRITIARQNNQAAIQDYNTYVQGFVSGIVAGHYGFKPMPYFEAAAGSDVAPVVKF